MFDCRVRSIALAALLFVASAYAGQLTVEAPPKPPVGFFQVVTPACIVETDISKAFADKVAGMVRSGEQKFYELFKLTPELMNGWSKQKFDNKANIPGTVMADMKFRPWVEVRVYKDYEKYSDEWFELTGVTDKVQRLRQGVPGAYFSVSQDYDKKRMLRRIRSFVADRDDDELERTLLHEMGHLFMLSYLLEFSGNPPPGQENQKRGTPSWLQEGLAQLFEIRWSRGTAAAQKAAMRQQAMMYEALNTGDAYPFETFINITNAHNLAAVANDPLKATINYAQSASVMDYMVHVAGARFFEFLQNLRTLHFQKNLMNRDKNHIPELYTLQHEAFKSAFQAELKIIEDLWTKDVKKKMELALKRQPELHYWIGEYYLRRHKDKEKDYVKAEEAFNTAMVQAPKKGEGYLGMGRMSLRKSSAEKQPEARKKLIEDAEAQLKKATEFMPKEEDAWYYLGIAQVNQGKLKEGCESFEKSIAIYSRNAKALAGLGQAAFAAGQYDKAMTAYEKAYEVDRNPYHLFEKGHAAFFGKKYRDAQAGFARFCEMFPQDAQGQLWYGLAAWRLEDKPFAITKLEAAAKLSPNDKLVKSALDLAKKGETLTFERESDQPAGLVDGQPLKPADAQPAKPEQTVRIDDE